ncbi:uncharacterized protein B0H18DRAFT_867533 [Fomitopsis serialis]|uniref:uncharacterized protein n=1 Tax=Fomitopsis serialis TaxID=139415 RepID=UPI002007C783|nr:uncharacterized protein B0H18DRAFT_867533 [Neoantrodia serialis]KAH9937701.1 hypothetical protein B0H18DRAFT_867533 [Neoantrodia serialis]
MDPKLFDELFSEPYGPYLDSEVLTDVCKSVPSKILGLTSLMLECGGKPIGLNQSEKYQPEYQESRVSKHGVKFRGVLTIERLDWLQPLARKRLNKDIVLRHVTVSHKEGRRMPRAGETPPLEHLYLRNMPNRRIKVIIQGVKHLPALYLSQILSMDARTYADSRKVRVTVLPPRCSSHIPSTQYFGRFRTLRTLERIVKIDDKIKRARGEPQTPRDERTPDWFAKMYKKYLANPAMARQRRIVWNSDDSDVEEDTEGKLRRGREHVLRHVSTAEVRSLMATHAEWILGDQQLRKQNRMLDLDVWAKWVRTSKNARIHAWLDRDPAKPDIGVKWGWFDDEDPNGPLSEDELEDEEPPERPRSKRKSKAKLGRACAGRTGPPHPEEEEEEGGNIYDPDFSPKSSAPASDWESDEPLPCRPGTPVSAAIARLIPSALYHPPVLPDSSFVWVCPVKGCDYELPLLELNEEHYRHLTLEDIQSFKEGRWTLSEQWVQRAFLQLVSKHYDDHMDGLGVVLHKHGNQTHLEWKNPRHHPPSPTRTRRPILRPDSDEEIKVEQQD